MSRPEVLVALERDYAIALGKYENAERAIETVIGLTAIEAADRRITAEKKILREKMERITGLIRLQVDPEWEPGHIRPIQPRAKSERHGEVSKAAYRVLKSAGGPLRVREIAHLVAPQLGVDSSDYRQINRLDSLISTTLVRREKDGMVFHDGGKPRRWSKEPPSDHAASAASASTLPTWPILAASLRGPELL